MSTPEPLPPLELHAALPTIPERADASFLGDLSGAVADLGILVPIVTALVLIAGIDPGTVFVGMGALYLVAGRYFRLPMPVQPVKAAAALVIANGLPAAQLAAAGVLLGAILLIVAMTGLADRLARLFALPIVRGLQLGVGLLLIKTAWKLPIHQHAISLVVAVLLACLLVHQSRRPRPLPIALISVVGGILVGAVVGGAPGAQVAGPALWHPQLNASMFDPVLLWSALIGLVIPQLPLTFGNAVVGLVDVQRGFFGTRADRVNIRSVGASMGIANIVVGCFSGMPMCHGSGGLTAHLRAGARSAQMNVIIGGPLLAGGLFFGPTLLTVLSLVPAAVLAGLLAFTGVTHALLTSDQRGYSLNVALAVGALGFLTTNLAWGVALGLVMHHGARFLQRGETLPDPI